MPRLPFFIPLLLLGFLFLFSGESVFAQNTKVLLIAVSKTTDATIPSLDWVKNDVSELEKTLRFRNGIGNVRVLGLDDIFPATKTNIEAEIQNGLLKESEKNDTIIVFFTGHGYADRRNPRRPETYLVTADFDSMNPDRTGMSVSRLRAYLEKCPAKNKFLFIDACYSEDNAKSPLAGFAPLASFGDFKGVFMLASAMQGQKSWPWEEREMSLFTYWLNEGLKGHADVDQSGFVSIDELYAFVHDNVVLSCRRLELKEPQTPVRMIEPNVSGVPSVVRLESTDLESLLDDIARQLASLMILRRISSVGMLELSIASKSSFSWDRDDYLLLQQYCSDTLESRIRRELVKGNYRVVDRTKLHVAIAESKSVSKAEDVSLPAPEELKVDGKPVKGLLSRTVLGREGYQFRLRCELCSFPSREPIATAGSVAVLSEHDWVLLGQSADLHDITQRKPKISPETARIF